MKHFDYEEEFHSKDRKQYRKERRIAQKTDRSKFKKTDLETKAERLLEHLQRGRVISISGEGALVDFDGSHILCPVRGLIKKETAQKKNLIAVGDWVRCTEDKAIVQIEERSSVLARTDISGRKEQLIAVNIDQVVITASFASPPLKPALIDRYIIAAQKGNIQPIIVINKIDLLESASEEEKKLYHEFLASYEPLGWPILSVSIRNPTSLQALSSLLEHKTSVFSGQSGVGKSSLLNACFGMNLKTGDLAAKTSKGSHTTTTASLIPLPKGGYCVDTPGIRSFGIWSLSRSDITCHFSDLAKYAKRCKYPDCLHINEPQCAVIRAIEKDKISLLRYQSYLALMDESQSEIKPTTWS